MRVLITGGSGSLGNALVAALLGDASVNRVVVFSRDEHKQHRMRERFESDPRLGARARRNLRFYVGDVRDPRALRMAMEGADHVILAHALKRIPEIEHNPVEALRTNVLGVQNAIDAARELPEVRKVILTSTDKAVEPINAYGFTKGMAERLVVSANFYRGSREIAFSAVRYGNVMDSRGSVLWSWKRAAESGAPIPVTHPAMTRFHLLLADGAAFVLWCLWIMAGGEVFVPDVKGYDMGTLLGAFRRIFPQTQEGVITGLRPGEKLHEVLVGRHEAHLAERFAGQFNFVRVAPPSEIVERYGLAFPYDDGHLEPIVGTREPLSGEMSSEGAARWSMDELEAHMRAAIARGEPE